MALRDLSMKLPGKSVVLALLLFGLCFMSAGCSEKESYVEGVVTLDGMPIGPGLTTFHPVGGGGVLSYAQFDTSGKYSVKSGSTTGLDAGEYLVTVSVYGCLLYTSPSPRDS